MLSPVFVALSASSFPAFFGGSQSSGQSSQVIDDNVYLTPPQTRGKRTATPLHTYQQLTTSEAIHCAQLDAQSSSIGQTGTLHLLLLPPGASASSGSRIMIQKPTGASQAGSLLPCPSSFYPPLAYAGVSAQTNVIGGDTCNLNLPAHSSLISTCFDTSGECTATCKDGLYSGQKISESGTDLLVCHNTATNISDPGYAIATSKIVPSIASEYGSNFVHNTQAGGCNAVASTLHTLNLHEAIPMRRPIGDSGGLLMTSRSISDWPPTPTSCPLSYTTPTDTYRLTNSSLSPSKRHLEPSPGLPLSASLSHLTSTVVSPLSSPGVDCPVGCSILSPKLQSRRTPAAPLTCFSQASSSSSSPSVSVLTIGCESPCSISLTATQMPSSAAVTTAQTTSFTPSLPQSPPTEPILPLPTDTLSVFSTSIDHTVVSCIQPALSDLNTTLVPLSTNKEFSSDMGSLYHDSVGHIDHNITLKHTLPASQPPVAFCNDPVSNHTFTPINFGPTINSGRIANSINPYNEVGMSSSTISSLSTNCAQEDCLLPDELVDDVFDCEYLGLCFNSYIKPYSR
ncbi:unnamed protein product [Protopolystoma xenopodis]|uniref:Uncharacterized protein n=1 Tax=Protopolystoma xenopodis TaxID=117903 RepID=A0A448WB69_9PLAT|nr:unnamed protein product [Protopolystoma xenopodis]